MVPFLAEKCNKYVRRNLKTNVFCILPHAQKFEDKELENRCWDVIEKETDEPVTSDEFVTVERSLVETIVKKEKLNVKEVELFKAVDRWATKESERQGLSPDGDTKRRILGEEIVKAIRFPLMSQKEFASVVIDSDILTSKEVSEMMTQFSNISTFPLPLNFKQAPRMDGSPVVHRCQRFDTFMKPPDTYRRYGAWHDSVNFSVNKPIMLHGVQHFGCEGVRGRYMVSTEIKDTTNDSSMLKQSGSYASVKDETYDYYGFDVLFDRPVCLKENREYKLISFMNGPMSWYGEDGQPSVSCHGVRITFCSSRSSNSATSEAKGQFPAFLFATLPYRS